MVKNLCEIKDKENAVKMAGLNCFKCIVVFPPSLNRQILRSKFSNNFVAYCY